MDESRPRSVSRGGPTDWLEQVTRLFNVLLQVLVLWSGMEGAVAIRSVMYVAGSTDALLTRGEVGADHPKLQVNVATAGSVANVVNIGGGRGVVL